MKFRRAMLLIGPGESPGPALASVRALAPRLTSLIVQLQSAPTLAGSLLPTGWGGLSTPGASDTSSGALQALMDASANLAARVELHSGALLDADALAERCNNEGVELLVPAVWSLRHERLANEVRKKAGLAILWPGSGSAPAAFLKHVGCVALSVRAGLRISAWLNANLDGEHDHAFTLLTTRTPAPELVERFIAISGLQVPLAVSSLGGWTEISSWLAGDENARYGLLLLPRPPPRLLLGVNREAPVLILPPLRERPETPTGPVMLAADAIDDRGVLRLCIEGAVSFGAPRDLADATLTIFSAGSPIVSVPMREGRVTTATPEIGALGLCRGDLLATPEALALVEATVEFLRPEFGPVILFDAALPDDVLISLQELDAPGRPGLLAVRMRPTHGLRAVRERLRIKGLPDRVLDARTVLDEGPAYDVDAEALDAVRLARVANRMQRAGFTVSAIVHHGLRQPTISGVHAIDVGASTSPPLPPVSAAPSHALPPLIEGNAIELELDNRLARTWLLEAIRGAKRELCFQVYMAADDVEGREVAEALLAAGARGVTVRVLVDSLHGLHGSFGTRNPLLERLTGAPGVELRIALPINELPSLGDLKQRDHRKIAVADGELALMGGRNLSFEYYAGFDEVPLRPESHWREVPWIDAGARVRGPAVGAILESFHGAWVEAQGTPFEFQAPGPAGSSSARVVVHHGLRDVHGLEAYRELIDGARSHVLVANGFPFVLELQYSLLQALARGVAVRVLTGHLTPTFGEGQTFKGPWSASRAAATEFVHSRVDPLVEAGADVHLATHRHEPIWDPAVAAVRPHVHAKVLTVDGLRCSVGSANLDVTASYWESELMLVTEDPTLVRALEADLSALMAASPRIDRDDPVWRERARIRNWMRHWPGVLSI